MAHDIKTIERKVLALDAGIEQLHAAKHAERLIPIIHRPGWTTVPEAALVHGLLDTLQHQTAGLQQTYKALLEAADLIGR
jgi:hypothetical protein